MKDYKILTTLIVEDTVFYIVKKDEWYLAIDSKYVTDGKINTQLNGLQMHAQKI